MDKAGNVLNHLLHNLLQKKQNKQGTIYYHFFNKWELIVGKRLYGHTKITDVKNGNLCVAVDHPGWLQMLKLQERRIIKSIKKLFPQLQIKSMRISVNEDFFTVETKNNDTEGNEKAKKTDEIVDENIQNIDNGEDIKKIDEIKSKELQNVLKRLYMSLVKKEEES